MLMYFQDMIDDEQNKIRNTAKSLSNRELITFLVKHGLTLGHPYVLTRGELIDRYCEIVFDRNHL
jgi:hypothetical protein